MPLSAFSYGLVIHEQLKITVVLLGGKVETMTIVMEDVPLSSPVLLNIL